MAETDTTTTAAAPATPSPAPAPAPPAPAAPPAQPARRAASISDAAFEALPSDQQANFSRIKASADGGSIWVQRDQLDKEPAAPGTAPAPGEKVKIGDFELSGEDVATILQEKAARDLRATQVPATAEAYTATLPPEFKLPAGVEYSFDETDPSYLAARNWAHGQGFTQKQFSELLSFHANSQAAEQVMIGNAAKAELEKLGAMGTARVTAIDQWLRGTIGDTSAQHIRRMMLTAGFVEGMEKIISKFASQGAASFSQSGREPASAPGRASDAEYAAMSSAERYAYAKSFDQKQFRN